MAQTRKHFERAIENVCGAMNATVSGVNADETARAREQAARTLFLFADGFAVENQRFNRTRFNEAAAQAIGGRDTFAALHGCMPFSKADFRD